MYRFVKGALVAAGIVCVLPPSLPAQSRMPQQPSAAGPQKIKACSLVTKEEVKKHLPWRPQLDQFPVEEEDIGTTGSSCNYPSVFVQVMLFTQGSIDAATKISGIETISGVGDEAWFSNNHDRFAELYVKVGKRWLTLQANLDGNMSTVKPGVIDLAKLFVDKLR